MADQNNLPINLEEIKVRGNQLVDKVRDIMEEGSARSLSIKKDGRTVFTIPLTVGVGGAAAAIFLHPTLAALGAFAALVTDVTIEVERTGGTGGSIIETPNSGSGTGGSTIIPPGQSGL